MGLFFGKNNPGELGIFLQNSNLDSICFCFIGDRITAVRINFGEMEFKDAEDILRSASPYEIEIEIEDRNSGVKRSFFRDQSYPTTRSQVCFSNFSLI